MRRIDGPRQHFARGARGPCRSRQIRLGYWVAAEEQLWLLIAKPDIGTHYGKLYTIEGTRFPGSDKRAQAFEAGAIDLASSGANGVIFRRGRGRDAEDHRLDFARKPERGYSTDVLCLGSSPIKTVERYERQDRSVSMVSRLGASLAEVRAGESGDEREGM